MKKMSKPIAVLMSLAMLLSLLAACSGGNDDNASAPPSNPTQEQPSADLSGGEVVVGSTDQSDAFVRQTEEGTLTIGSTQPVDTFNPYAGNSGVSCMVFDTLVEKDPTNQGEIIPCLAESWEWSDDYLTCTFHLRDDVYFSNGEKLTSEDVYYTLYAQAHSTGMGSSYYTTIDFDKSSCPDDLTFVMVMKQVEATIMMYLSNMPVGILCKSWAENATAEDWWSAPVGTGAYTVVENVDGAYTTLKANENYWKGAPEAKFVTYKFFGDANAMFIAYESGELDVACNILETDLQRVLSGSVSNTNYVITSERDFKNFVLCDYVEVFKDPQVREAISYAIDANACIAVAFGALGNPMTSNVNSSAKYSIDCGTYEYNPEKARELLAAAGYKDGDINLRCVIMNTNTDQLLAETIQAYLSEVGINMEIEAYVMTTAIPMLRDGNCDVTLTGTGGGAYDAAVVFDKISNKGTDKSTIINDEALQAAIDKGAGTMDDATRAEAYAEAQQIMYDQHYFIPIVDVNSAYVYRSYIADFPMLVSTLPNAYYCHFAG